MASATLVAQKEVTRLGSLEELGTLVRGDVLILDSSKVVFWESGGSTRDRSYGFITRAGDNINVLGMHYYNTQLQLGDNGSVVSRPSDPSVLYRLTKEHGENFTVRNQLLMEAGL
jgi:hypothetical protein